jgi:hypothetical protein
MQKDEQTYVTANMIREAAPSRLWQRFSLAFLLSQRRNPVRFLASHRGQRHHAPHYFRVHDVLTWWALRYPQYDYASFAKNLRKLALKAPPLEPVKPSKAGPKKNKRGAK